MRKQVSLVLGRIASTRRPSGSTTASYDTARTLEAACVAFDLGDHAALHKISRRRFETTLAHLLTTGIAYPSERIMAPAKANAYVRKLVEALPQQAKFFSNSQDDNSIADGASLFGASFELGVLAVSGRGSICVWALEED